MKKPLISIIMPVYNAENQVSKSIESVINQSSSNWELILINDGSTDGTKEVCKKFAKAERRLTLISIKNSGPANARNIGIANAIGKYCIFIDSDDYISQETIEKLSNLIINYPSADLIFYGYTHEELKNNEYIIKHTKAIDFKSIYTNKEFKKIYELLFDNNFTHPVWNKLYNLKTILDNNIEFPKGINISEDFIFNLMFYEQSSTIIFSPDVFYHYVSHSFGSITSRFDKSKINSIYDVYLLSLTIMERWNQDMVKHIDNEFVKNINVYINSLYNDDVGLSYSEKRKIVNEIISNTILQQCLVIFKPLNRRNEITRIMLKSGQPDLILFVSYIISLRRKLKKIF